MGDHVAYMKILVMTYGRQDRKRILRYHCSHLIIIKACQIKFRAASPEDQHRIIFLAGLQHGVQCCDYRRRAVSTLHQGREKLRGDFESVWIFIQVTDEVPIAGCVGGRYDRQVIRQSRQREALLHVHQALFLQSLNGLLSLQFLDSERKLRIYIVDYQRKSIQLTIIHLHFHQQSHALLYRRACHRFEIWRDESVFRAPDDGA